MNTLKKLLSYILVFMMFVNLLPVSAVTEDEQPLNLALTATVIASPDKQVTQIGS